MAAGQHSKIETDLSSGMDVDNATTKHKLPKMAALTLHTPLPFVSNFKATTGWKQETVWW